MAKGGYNKQNWQLIEDWADAVKVDRVLLLGIEIANSQKSKYGMSVNKSWLSKQTGIHRKVAEREPEIFFAVESVVQEMIDEGIVLSGESASSNNIRRCILQWYEGLNAEEKELLPVSRKGLLIKKACPLSYHHERTSKAVSSAIKNIQNEHLPYLPPPKVMNPSGRKLVSDFVDVVDSWVGKVSQDINLMRDVPVIASKDKTIATYQVSKSWVVEKLQLTDGLYPKFRQKINSIIPFMINANVISPGSTPYEINSRNRLIKFYGSLSEESKRKLPIRDNKVSGEYLKSKGITLQPGIIRDAMNTIHDELEDMGVIKVNHEYVADWKVRRENANKSYWDNVNHKMESWNELGKKPLNSISDLMKQSDAKPLIHIAQLFSFNANTGSYKGARTGYCFFEQYLKDKYGESPVSLQEALHPHILLDVKSYLKGKIAGDEFGEAYANGLLSAIRRVISTAMAIRALGEEPLYTDGFQVSRKTDRYRPFDSSERTQIVDAINDDLTDRRTYLLPYVESKNGENPFDANFNLKRRGIGTENNAKWLFENIFNKEPISAVGLKKMEGKSIQQAYVNLLIRLGGIHEIYKKWHVPSNFGKEFLLPYMYRLAQVTGLNSESICELEIHDYVESHPSTGRPCMRYWKERSTGEKEYHLDIFKAKLGWLSTKQSYEIKQIFEEVIALTKRLRREASEELKDKLFIYKKRKGGAKVSKLFVISTISINNLSTESTKYGKRHNLTCEDGSPSQFNLARFRPTFVSELIHLGVSIREIQLLLGHSTIGVTMGYLDKLDFNKAARSLLSKKLNEIHSKVYEIDETKEEKTSQKFEDENIIFKTPLASCKNIFDPPDFVKKLPNYIPGTPCSSYNKCLSCENVIITKNHLPELFAMQRDYLALTSRERIMDTPYGHVISENLVLLNAILIPEESDFPVDVLELAQERSRFIETSVLIDGVIA